MKKLLSLVLAFAMLLSVCVLAHGEEAAQKYDLKGMTVKVRNWDTPNPYAAETDQVDKDRWLPIYEAAKAKYNCELSSTIRPSSTMSSPPSGCSPSRPAAPAMLSFWMDLPSADSYATL